MSLSHASPPSYLDVAIVAHSPAIEPEPARLGPKPPPLPPGPVEPEKLDEWLDRQAAMYRVDGSKAAALLARIVESAARDARVFHATTAEEYDDRFGIMREADWPANPARPAGGWPPSGYAAIPDDAEIEF